MMGRCLVLSWCYRVVRWLTLHLLSVVSPPDQRWLILERAIAWGDQRMAELDRWAGTCLFDFQRPSGLAVPLYDLTFLSPLVVSSFKGDWALLSIWVRMGMGGVTLKTILPQFQQGNALPRIQEVTVQGQKTIINAMGLPGPGVEGLIEEWRREKPEVWQVPVGLSLGGHTCEEYRSGFLFLNEQLEGDQTQRYWEINISCPNTQSGQDLGKNPELLEDLLRFMRSKTDRPIGVKLSPDQSDESLQGLTRLVGEFEKTYINLGNTQYRRCAQVGLPDEAISVRGGGLSGRPLFGRTVEMVELLAPLGVPIMATGGVCTADHVKILRERGALLVGMATALVLDPYCVPKILRSV